MKKINRSKYQGYIWRSDQRKPIVLLGKEDFSLELEDYEIPFIVEARLWDQEKLVSINIDCINGVYYIRTHTFSNLDFKNDSHIEIKKFLPHERIRTVLANDASRLLFLRKWDIDKSICEEFDVLSPGELIFLGFTK